MGPTVLLWLFLSLWSCLKGTSVEDTTAELHVLADSKLLSKPEKDLVNNLIKEVINSEINTSISSLRLEIRNIQESYVALNREMNKKALELSVGEVLNNQCTMVSEMERYQQDIHKLIKKERDSTQHIELLESAMSEVSKKQQTVLSEIQQLDAKYTQIEKGLEDSLKERNEFFDESKSKLNNTIHIFIKKQQEALDMAIAAFDNVTDLEAGLTERLRFVEQSMLKLNDTLQHHFDRNSPTADDSKIRKTIITCDTTNSQVYKIDLETESYSYIPNQNTSTPVAISFDNIQKRIYYSDVRFHQIRRTNLEASESVVVKQFSDAVPDGIAVDEINRLLFYTDYKNELVAYIDMDRSNEKIVATTAVGRPRGIALDTLNKVLYWTDWGTEAKIEKASYDGSQRQTLASSDLVLPNDIVMDTQTGKLIFADAGTKTIQSMNKDGSGRKVIYKAGGAHLFGIYVDQFYIYYSDWKRMGIFRINKDGTNMVIVGPPSIGKLSGIHIIKDEVSG